MATKAVKTLGLFQKATELDKGLASRLPEAYKKFYREWKFTQPAAVHYIPEPGKWKRNEVTGELLPVQNIPLPVFYPKESHNHIWGGEGIVQGFLKRDKYRRRVPHFWVPILKRSVVYSEVLDKYISVVVTDRALNLINTHYGLDHYLLKTPACDLRSLLALTLKRKILQELRDGCPTFSNNPKKQKHVLEQYKQYLTAYTSEEIDWYGYSLTEACRIFQTKIEAEEQSKIVPLKQVYRAELIEKLKAASISESAEQPQQIEQAETASWLQKMNPFGKKHET
ncbi:39S ribosomal protein L28, mitochondrial [Diorhabda sublineata]|uniref:39S ribosomal protein L28, mitochondrial n=1 Tax=Diorhabda sublineata TaxID=1163346 RepID=UPI0024E14451|nr:39S ribosomal protein L28, mitochondrial [Diorhabda sublineata]